MNRLNISEEQEKNLRILASYLLSGKLKAVFDMSTYTDVGVEYNEDELTQCGTVGCALGHGPYAGIPKLGTEGWQDYATRCFAGRNAMLQRWLFWGAWADHDNTPEGAAKRILYILNPENNLAICNLIMQHYGWYSMAVEEYNSTKI